MAVEERACSVTDQGEAMAPSKKLTSEEDCAGPAHSACNGCTPADLAPHRDSLKSPVTPAPVNEHDDSPALKWKSYVSSQREAANKPGIDPKGKLVINLCSAPRGLEPPSPTSMNMKPNEISAKDSLICESSDVQHAVSRHPPTAKSAGDATIRELAKRVRLRVKRSRLPSKPKVFQRRSEANKVALEASTAVKQATSLSCGSKDSAQVHDSQQSALPGDDVYQSAGMEKLQNQPPERPCVINDVTQDEPSTDTNLHTELKAQAVVVDQQENANVQKVSKEMAIKVVTKLECGDREISPPVGGGEPEHSECIRLSEEAHMDACFSKERELVAKAGEAPPVECNDHLNMDKEVKGTSFNEHRDDLAHDAVSKEGSARDGNSHHRGSGEYSASGRGRPAARTCSMSAHDNGTASETSKLDMREQTLLETLLPDEPPGYSSAGGSEPSRTCANDRVPNAEHSQTEESESDGASGEARSDEGDSYSIGSEESEDEDDYSNSQESEEGDSESPPKRFSPGTPGRGTLFSEQVPSVLCDAEGNIWHIGKRAKQARGVQGVQTSSPSDTELREKPSSDHKFHADERQDKKPASEMAPFSHQIQLNWTWPDVDNLNSTVPDLCRSTTVKERSVFVGCIPDGVENLVEVLQNLMEKFLERFDFAPASVGQLRVVKVVKDFAFLELATEKVAQIVLAANQLDVFEWGINGYHFNIQGCTGTYTSVRPLIEYMPLKPARTIFVGKIPKSRWQKEYLVAFFSRLLRGSDGPAASKIVTSVYLLPESSDAYLELASELMADSLMFKCTKNPQLLEEIGEDVFICRDASSVPMMSRHKGTVCPQRSLFIGISACGEEFKIDCVRKVFDEILPMISRKYNQPGYIEYVCLQPGKDYAFFQFNSEAIVDAIMDEYIEDTQLFVCRSGPVPYIILRPPGYVRPGAKYKADSNHKGQSGSKHQQMIKAKCGQEKQERRSIPEQAGSVLSLLPRRFGDEPTKKPDCIYLMGVSPLPLATWNGLSSAGACSADPECMLIIEGLPKGLSYKLARGALNELFERALCRTGLVEVGMLVLRYLDRDGNLDAVASLPNAKFVYALLSLRRPYVVAGQEIRLLCKDWRKNFTCRRMPVDLLGGQGDLSCLSDDDAAQGWRLRNTAVGDQNGLSFACNRKHRYIESEGHPVCVSDARGPSKRKGAEYDADEQGNSEAWRSVSPFPKQVYRPQLQEMMQHQNGQMKHGIGKIFTPRPSQGQLKKGNVSRGKISYVQENIGYAKSESRQLPKDILKIVSKEGRREVQMAPASYARDIGASVGKVNFIRAANKRKRLEAAEVGSMANSGPAVMGFMKRTCFS